LSYQYAWGHALARLLKVGLTLQVKNSFVFFMWVHGVSFIRKNLVHFNHHFATTMRLLSKPITFVTSIFVILCVHVVARIYLTCAIK
jgi:hypothetical protein